VKDTDYVAAFARTPGSDRSSAAVSATPLRRREARRAGFLTSTRTSFASVRAGCPIAEDSHHGARRSSTGVPSVIAAGAGAHGSVVVSGGDETTPQSRSPAFLCEGMVRTRPSSLEPRDVHLARERSRKGVERPLRTELNNRICFFGEAEMLPTKQIFSFTAWADGCVTASIPALAGRGYR